MSVSWTGGPRNTDGLASLGVIGRSLGTEAHGPERIPREVHTKP